MTPTNRPARAVKPEQNQQPGFLRDGTAVLVPRLSYYELLHWVEDLMLEVETNAEYPTHAKKWDAWKRDGETILTDLRRHAQNSGVY